MSYGKSSGGVRGGYSGGSGYSGGGTRAVNPPKKIGGDAQGRGSRLNTDYYTTKSGRWGDTIVPRTDIYNVTSSNVRTGKDSYGTNYVFSPKQAPVQVGAASTPLVVESKLPTATPVKKQAAFVQQSPLRIKRDSSASDPKKKNRRPNTNKTKLGIGKSNVQPINAGVLEALNL